MLKNYFLGESTRIKISEIDFHPVSEFLSAELMQSNLDIYGVFVFNMRKGFFLSSKELFLSFCYNSTIDKDKLKPRIETILDSYFNNHNDPGMNIIDLCLDIESEADFIRYIESKVKPFYGINMKKANNIW